MRKKQVRHDQVIAAVGRWNLSIPRDVHRLRWFPMPAILQTKHPFGEVQTVILSRSAAGCRCRRNGSVLIAGRGYAGA